MRKLLTEKKGSLSIILLGLMFCLLLLTFLVLELGATYYRYDQAENILQRAVNSSVESNINDRYRADKDLRLNTAEAESSFRTFVTNDFPAQYQVRIESVSTSASPPTMTATGTICFATIFSQFGFDDVSYHFSVKSTNYDLE